jgi:hypothetical protein
VWYNSLQYIVFEEGIAAVAVENNNMTKRSAFQPWILAVLGGVRLFGGGGGSGRNNETTQEPWANGQTKKKGHCPSISLVLFSSLPHFWHLEETTEDSLN